MHLRIPWFGWNIKTPGYQLNDNSAWICHTVHGQCGKGKSFWVRFKLPVTSRATRIRMAVALKAYLVERTQCIT